MPTAPIQRRCGATPIAEPQDIATRFRLDGAAAAAERHGGGHINDTWLVTTDRGGRYILQRINRQVFTDPVALMDNVRRVTDYLHERAGSGEQTLSLVPTRDDGSYLVDDEGEYWRAYHFIEGARTLEVAENLGQVRDAAALFGRFQRLLSELPGPPLHETIPGFHDTPARYRQFHAALAADAHGRARECGAEIDLALGFEAGAGLVAKLQAAGALPQRIVHNDTKLDNVLFDERSGAAVCVVDFDTVMPGTVLSDFGDLVRSAASSAAEGDTNYAGVYLRMDSFTALAEGYLGAAAEFLADAEIDNLAVAGRIITVEIGLRFLTDYLSGDTYFRIASPQQNLERCRSQFTLAASIDARLAEMRAVIAAIAARTARGRQTGAP